jgi:outer membrane protein assembly factor BamD (BamD/ComL family)
VPISAPAAAAAPSLVEESRGLAAVQTALGTRDFNRALALLDAQEHDYRAGSLGQERAAARVLALCGAGRTSEAVAARARFVNNYPGSPLIRRINVVCAK